jgi:predicted metal-dependent peptidase
MKFTKVMGTINASLVTQAEEKLSQVFLDLGVKYDNRHVGTGMGGDPLIFSLLYPVEHICTMSIPTAATDGKRFYWNPKFVLKQSKIGLRIICGHEAWHALYMHPQRRGSRLPKLWNIAVDYIVNGTVMDDFKARQMDPKKMFKEHLGRFMGLNQYAELIKNPFAKIKGFEDLNPSDSDSQTQLPSPDEDRDLTPEEQKELERREKKVTFFFADPDLDEEMKKPEKIYDYLYSLLPKCPSCGRVGVYSPKKDNQGKSDNNEQAGQSDQSDQSESSDGKQHDHGDGQPCDCNDHDNKPGSGCGHCGDGVDVFGLGGTVDEHMDTEESEEKLAKKISDAMEAAKKMAGVVPASLEDELGKLTAPKITWQDIIRTRITRARSGNGKNDWTRFKTRPMFSGLLVPKRKNYFAQFGCLLDTSGSMSKDDMAFGVSQLQSLDERAEAVLTCADSNIYWEKSVKLKRFNAEELSKIVPTGRGGTVWESYFREYEKHIGKCDFLIIITDGYLLESDLIEMRDPGIPVYWLITSGHQFKAPFGRVFDLHS